MVTTTAAQLMFSELSEEELNGLLEGREPATSRRPLEQRGDMRISAGRFGAVWRSGTGAAKVPRPLLLIVREEEMRRLFGRIAQLRSDLSPLTAWCHVLTPQRAQPLDSLTRKADLAGLDAAWAGLVVAEALLLSGDHVSGLRIQGCLATSTFAIARARALWGKISAREVTELLESAQRLVRRDASASASTVSRIRSAVAPIWASLSAVGGLDNAPVANEVRPIVGSLRALQMARETRSREEAPLFAAPLLETFEGAHELSRLDVLRPEARLQLFDRLIAELDNTMRERGSAHWNALTVAAGYLATVAAGGKPSLALVESVAARLPEVAAWSYVVGGIGEPVTWTAGFDGLGRLIARELSRPVHFDEAPTCDVSLEETVALVDSKLSDPLVRLRVKQARIITVSVCPGVNVPIPLAEATTSPGAHKAEARHRRGHASAAATRPIIDASAVVETIWPRFQHVLETYLAKRLEEGGSESRSATPGGQQTLQLSHHRAKGSRPNDWGDKARMRRGEMVYLIVDYGAGPRAFKGRLARFEGEQRILLDPLDGKAPVATFESDYVIDIVDAESVGSGDSSFERKYPGIKLDGWGQH